MIRCLCCGRRDRLRWQGGGFIAGVGPLCRECVRHHPDTCEHGVDYEDE